MNARASQVPPSLMEELTVHLTWMLHKLRPSPLPCHNLTLSTTFVMSPATAPLPN